MPENIGNITVYKASAGSGKTFRLTVEYLKILIKNPYEYRNILAVTFTNKATNEMKSRILTELNGIAKRLPDSSTYLNQIKTELNREKNSFTEEIIVENAQKALTLLLHDYSRFRIETIDSFFQTVLRNLAKELGLSAYVNLELDNNEVIDDAVNELLDNVSPENNLMQKVSSFISHNIDNDKKWDISGSVKEFSKDIFGEEFRSKSDEVERILLDKDFIKNYRKEIDALEKSYSDRIVAFIDKFNEICKENSLVPDDFLYSKSGGPLSFFDLSKILKSDGRIGKRILDASESSEKWAPKSSAKASIVKDLAERYFMGLLKGILDLLPEFIVVSNSCNLIRKNLYNLDLINDIDRIVRGQNAENNRFLLSDTPMLLNKMISDGDAPFIYEKIGATLSHIMIDEFQDTSVTQWKNFMPLIVEGVSQGENSLIVGDQKQSIYRWRNGDWRILGNLKEELNSFMSESQIDEVSLKQNWRSEYEVINFNNNLFKELLKTNEFSGNSDEEGPENLYRRKLYEEIAKAYADVAQEPIESKGKRGYVKVIDIAEDIKKEADAFKSDATGEVKKTADDFYCEHLLQAVKTLQDNGVKPKDIAILARTNSRVAMVADYLTNADDENGKYCFKVVSDEAFQLSSSPTVGMLVDAFRLIVNPDDASCEYMLKYKYYFHIKGVDRVSFIGKLNFGDDDEWQCIREKIFAASCLPLYEMTEELYSILLLSKIEQQQEFMLTFLDKISKFISDRSADVNDFLNYYDSVLYKKNIQASADTDGIRIMTIHKSKGLEFHSVIIPFCDWAIADGKSKRLWCDTEHSIIGKLPVVPVEYGKKMSNSLFQAHYFEEEMQMKVDSLNVLYVALTRAEKNMLVICNSSKGGGSVSISKPIVEALKNYSGFSNEEKDCKGVYEFGEMCPSEEKRAKHSDNVLKNEPEVINFNFCSYKQKGKFRQSNKSRDFIEEKVWKTNKFIDRGKLLHSLFANIKTVDDIENSVRKLTFDGLIGVEEEKELIDFVKKSLSNKDVQDWFCNDADVFNECSIISLDENGVLETRRPDRVIFKDGRMTVIDFKFGKEKEVYKDQVREYMDLISKMNYDEVSGYLWYVYSNKIVEVV